MPSFFLEPYSCLSNFQCLSSFGPSENETSLLALPQAQSRQVPRVLCLHSVLGSALPADALAGSGNVIPTVLWWIQTTAYMT